MKVHHIGYLVKNMGGGIKAFELLGYTIARNVVYDEIRCIDICFMKNGEYVVELISPTSRDSVVSELIKRYRNSPYHICYITDDFGTDYDNLINNKHYVAIGEPAPAPALGGKNVVFLMNPYIGMIELLEN